MACRSAVLKVNVDGPVGVLREPRAIADAEPVERIRHKAILRVAHRQRPEGIIRWKTAQREVDDIVVLSGERMTCAISGRRPVHRLLRYVDRAGKNLSARGSEKHAVPGLAASAHGEPAIDPGRLDPGVNLGRDK